MLRCVGALVHTMTAKIPTLEGKKFHFVAPRVGWQQLLGTRGTMVIVDTFSDSGMHS